MTDFREQMTDFREEVIEGLMAEVEIRHNLWERSVLKLKEI